MTDAADDTLALLDARDPHALALARVAALAARVEPELLRALRLALLPGASAATEAELWFSEAVFARGARSLTLDAEVTARLRTAAAAEPRDRLARARRIIGRLHRHAPPLMRLEEQLVMWALRGRVAQVDAALAPIVGAMLSTPARARDLAAWAQRALPRLPPAARDAGAYWALLHLANHHLPSSKISAPASAAAIDERFRAIFDRVGDTHVTVERRGDAVRLRLADREGNDTVPAPALPPITVVVTSTDLPAAPRIVTADTWCDDIPVAGPTVRVQVADGRTHVVTSATAPTAAPFDPRPACVRIESFRGARQTGFLVTRDLIATAHLPDHEIGETVRMTLSTGAFVESRIAHNDRADVALLRLVQPPHLAPLPLREARLEGDRVDWEVVGFPTGATELVAIAGPTIVTAELEDFQLPVLSTDDSVLGLAGSPVIVGDEVAGYVWSASTGGLIAGPAARLAKVLRWLGALPSPAPSTLFAPTGRSIYAPAADAMIADAVRDHTGTLVIGGDGHQRSGLLRRLAGSRTDVRYARTFAPGDPFPEELLAHVDQAGLVILDRTDALAVPDQERLDAILDRAPLTGRTHYAISRAGGVPAPARTAAYYTFTTERLPRDRFLRAPLTTFDTRPDVLAAWGPSTLVEMLTTAVELGVVYDPDDQHDLARRTAVQAAHAWLDCPCAHHAAIELPGPNAPAVDALVGLIRAAQDGDTAAATMHASLGLGAALTADVEPEVLHLRLTRIFGGDEARRAEATAAGRMIAWIELAGDTPFTEKLAPIRDALRAAAGDDDLEVFHAERNAAPAERARLVVETTRDGYTRLLGAHRRHHLTQLGDLRVRWIADPYPPVDLDDVNRGRFGGVPSRDGVSLDATVERVDEQTYLVRVRVELTHAAYQTSEPHVEIFDGNGNSTRVPVAERLATATMRAWGSFVIGARYGAIRVELDLATVPGAPDDFVAPPHERSAIPLAPGTTWRYQATSANSLAMHGASGVTTMTIVDSRTVDATRPIIVALVRGDFLSSGDRVWLLVRFGSLYCSLPGDAAAFTALCAQPDRIEPLLRGGGQLLFRFPIGAGAPLTFGDTSSDGWRCTAAIGDTYTFGRGAEALTVTAGTGVTHYRNLDGNGTETMVSLVGMGPAPTRPPPMDMAQAFALVIGISSYPRGRLARASQDAAAVHELLCDPSHGGYQVDNTHLLLDEDATGAAIQDALARLAAQTTASSTVFVYFAGHSVKGNEERDRSPMLIPIDGERDDATRPSGVIAIDLVERLRSLPARHVAVVVVGAMTRYTEARPSAFSRPSELPALARGQGRALLTASHGSFTNLLLEGLGGKAEGAGGVVRIVDLARHIERRIREERTSRFEFHAEVEENFPIALHRGGAPTPLVVPPPAEADRYAYDGFVSYRRDDRDDKAWVEKVLIPHLEGAGLKLCLEHRDFRIGESRLREMERAVISSRYVIGVLTPAYLGGPFQDFQQTIARFLAAETDTPRFLPLLRKPCEPALGVRATELLDVTDDDEVPAALDRLAIRLREPPRRRLGS